MSLRRISWATFTTDVRDDTTTESESGQVELLIRPKAAVAKTPASARERVAKSRQGRLVRTIPVTRLRCPRRPGTMKRSSPSSPAPEASSRPASSRDGARSARSRVSMPTTSATTRRARRRIRQEPSAGRDTSAIRSAGLTSTLTGRRPTRRGRSVRRTPASQSPSGSKGRTTSAAEETSSCSSATRGTVRAVTRQSTSARTRRLSSCGSLAASSWAISDATPGSATSTIRTTCAAAAGRKSVTVSIRSRAGTRDGFSPEVPL